MMLIYSVNVNGLRNTRRRQNIFNWFETQKADIILIQETHCENDEKKQEWIKDWKGDSFWSFGTSLSKGVTFLFREHTNFNILSHEIYENGRLMSLKIEINGTKLQILNIYTPNVPIERKRFFRKIKDKLDDAFVHIIAGDFNCVIDASIDRCPPSVNRDQGQIEMNEMIHQCNLDDIFRKRFPTKHSFTFSRGSSKSRIDLFFTSRILDSNIKSTEIVHFPFSDHDAIKLNVLFSQSARGPGIWKMNIKTIQSNIFREIIESLWPVWTTEIGLYDSPISWWENIKYKIKHLTIEVSKSINITKSKFLKIEARLNEIKDSQNNIVVNECKNLKQQIKEYYENQLEAAKIRSRIKIYEEGEKSSKFFFNTEKKNAAQKVWIRIKCQDGTYSSDINVILNEQKQFYKKIVHF